MVNRSLIGQIVGKYKIVESLGRGGMAEVFRAYQKSLDRDVAIKVMHSFLADEQGFLRRFQREARAMASLGHSNIVDVYDFDVQEGMHYIVMEYVNGGTLKQKLESLASRGERMLLGDVVRTIIEVTDALAYAHARQMIHRDIKPGNIMINDQGQAVLTDFGIAKILSGPSFTATGAMIGTPAYMSPEQGLGQPGDERSDLYAVGVLFYQMATGQLPYDADTPLAVILKHVNEPIPSPAKLNANLPESIQKVMLKALAKKPDERYQTAQELIKDLQEAAKSSEVDLKGTLPIGLLTERPTYAPAPSQTRAPVQPTVVSSMSTSQPVGATRIASQADIEATEVAAPIQPVAAPEKKKRNWGLTIGIATVATIAVAAGAFFAFGGTKDETPIPTSTVEVVVIVPTEEDTPTQAPSPTNTLEPGPTADFVQTSVAAFAATQTAQPTETLPPTIAPSPTASSTPDMTATFLATCVSDIELVNAYTYQNEATSAAAVGVSFPMTWVIRNIGECPLPEGLTLEFDDDQPFGLSEPIILEEEMAPGDEVELTAQLEAPRIGGRYSSTWRLIGEDGEPIGTSVEFEVFVFVPATATPAVTNTPVNTPGPTQPFGYNWTAANCQYVGGNWQCDLVVTPHGGIGPYSFATDEEPPGDFTGTGPFIHPVIGGRCFPWVHTLTLTDEGTGQIIREAIFLDPNNFFPGGCVTS